MDCEHCGACDDEPRLQLFCGWCGARFFVCESCYHGEAYCGPEHRAASQAEIDREKQRRYRKTPTGKENHRERSWAYRVRVREAVLVAV